jgi:biopolymer transport protein ExbD
MKKALICQKAVNKYQKKNPKAIEIRVTKDREIFISNNQYTMLEFPDSFRNYSDSFSKETKIVIKADEKLSYKDVMLILKSVKDSQFSKISLATNG